MEAATKLTDELIELDVVHEAATEDQKVNNFLMFWLQKLYQPCKYRCITDGKAGGQNGVCVRDQCQMTIPYHILPHLYTHDWSNVLGASKYFMFLIKENQHKFLGLIYHGNKIMHVYSTLPSKTRNSPGALEIFGPEFLRNIIDNFHMFQRTSIDNSRMVYFAKKV